MSAKHDAIPVQRGTTIALTLVSAIGVLAFGWPLLVEPGTLLAHNDSAPLVLATVLISVMVIVLIALSDGGIDVKAIAVLGVLSAIGAVLRPLSAGSLGIEFVFFFIILGGRVFGPGFGFVLGSTTLFSSALLTGGVGPWLPFQMLAASWIGLGAGLLPSPLRGRIEVLVLAGYAAVCGFLYGQAMNLSFWPFTIGANTALSFTPGATLGDNLHSFLLFSIVTSLGWDLMRATVLATGIIVIGRPVLAALRRAAKRAFFAASASGPLVPRGAVAEASESNADGGR
ncbi:MAG: ECF transporter S component [Terrimesophilobacter sp.]